MYAQCPGCYSIYCIDAVTLSQGGGWVRCSVCELVFNALPTLRDELPPPNAEPLPGGNAELALAYDEPEQAPAAAAPAQDDGFEPQANNQPPREAGKESARKTRQTVPRIPMRWFWLAGCGLLGVLLLIQLVVRAPQALAHYAKLRPVAEALCSVSGCELRPRQDLSRIRLASRDVRAHPSVPNALIVSATLVNDAGFTQAYPLLELRLSDLDGRLVAMRRFDPATYLPGAVTWREGLAPHSRTRVSLEVVDPGAGAVSFEFAFRPPRPVSG